MLPQSRTAIAVALALILLSAVGCGQKGDLFLPDNTTARYK
jgi:predicted small lipoprotein YifL